MRPDNHFRFFLGQDGDAQITLAICVAGAVIWALTIAANVRWLERANGNRPFVRHALWQNGCLAAITLTFLIGSSYLQSISDDPVLRGTFWTGRIIAGLIAPMGAWRLRRDIDRRSGH